MGLNINVLLSATIVLQQILLIDSVCDPLGPLSLVTIVRLNGEVASADSYKQGETLQYRCAVNYMLVDANTNISVISPNTTCMASETWSLTAVACVELQCIDPPPPISNGFGLPSSPPYTVGSEVTYNCNDGYQIQFPDNEQGLATTIFCRKNAQWSRVPICKRSPGLSLSNGLAVAVGIFAFLFMVSLCFAIACSLWAFYLRRQLTCGDMAEDEVAYAKSHGAFTLNNPIVTATVKDEESAGNPLYLTPDEMNEFESKKRQLGGTG